MAVSLPQSVSRHLTLNAILKYKNHPNMNVLKIFFQPFWSFDFLYVEKKIFLKRLKNKAVQDSNIPLNS